MGAAALLLNVAGSNNTAVGTDALVHSTADANTAMGAFSLLNNLGGIENVAVGFNALNANVGGSFSVAVGFNALGLATGAQNTAVGDNALALLTTGGLNTAIGDLAGFSYSGGESGTIVIGALSANGSVGVAGDNNTIRIGDNLLPTDIPTPQCFIGGIAANSQTWNGVTVCQVTVNFFGHLGFDCVNPENRQIVPAAHQPMLNDKVEKLQASNAKLRATVTRQQRQIDELTADLQRVSAQLEVRKPATKVVVNKP